MTFRSHYLGYRQAKLGRAHSFFAALAMAIR